MCKVTIVRDEQTLQAAFAVRKVVFVDEQGVDPNLEYDGCDQVCTHLVLRYNQDIVGTVRLLPLTTGIKLGRLAILPAYRGKGLGSQLLKAALDYVWEQGYTQVNIHAQVHAVGFYAHHGFRVTSAEFSEAGIRHVCMEITAEQNRAGYEVATK